MLSVDDRVVAKLSKDQVNSSTAYGVTGSVLWVTNQMLRFKLLLLRVLRELIRLKLLLLWFLSNISGAWFKLLWCRSFENTSEARVKLLYICFFGKHVRW